MERRLLIASWLFLIGSSLFMIDAISEIDSQFSPMSLLHLSEGVLFLVGSIFFMLNSQSDPSRGDKLVVGHHRGAIPKEGIEMLKGGCFCGDIRYEAGGTPFHLTNCHCSICHRTTGAPFVAWFSVPRSGFRFVQGTPTQFRSTLKGMRSFCPRCGTQLTFEHDDASDEIDVTTCSLDEPERLPPEDQTRTSGSSVNFGVESIDALAALRASAT